MSELQFLSIGASKVPHASDWSEELQLFAFAAGYNVALWNQNRSVERVIKTHTQAVTVVKFMKNSRNETLLITGSEDKTIKVWDIRGSSNSKLLQTIQLESTVMFLAVESSSSSQLMISGSLGSNLPLRSWKLLDDNTFVLADSCNVGRHFSPLGGAIFTFDDSENTKVLAVGGTSKLLHLFLVDKDHKLILANVLEGHENWIKVLEFTRTGLGEVLLATGSADTYIRLWKFEEQQQQEEVSLLEKLKLDNNEKVSESITNKKYKLTSKLYVTFEALLMGHDDWISGLKWHPEDLSLFSASADSSLMQWKPDESSGIWICSTRLGDVSIKGSSTATGSSGGFWTLVVAKQGHLIGTVTATGSWRLWEQSKNLATGSDDWVSLVSITGHTKEVTDCSWQDDEEYLLTTSLDQTTRLFAPVKTNSVTTLQSAFYEFSRPQIHGYDMICVKSMSSTVFVSAGDEKTIRVFEEPKGVADLLTRVSGSKAPTDSTNLPGSATVPALGLSNKESTDDAQADVADDEFEDRVINGGFTQNPNHLTTADLLLALEGPPKEEHLQRHTLWPEIQKLYGHGYEISSIDISHDKSLLATCCKSNNETHAVIRVYDTKTWHQLQPLDVCHNLTVTRVRFSPDDSYLLSVSRDRTYAIWKRQSPSNTENASGAAPYLLALTFKGHSRIIWDCAWVDNQHFVTSGRDKTVKLWNIDGKLLAQTSFSAAVTAVDYCHVSKTVVVGTETGSLHLCKVTIPEKYTETNSDNNNKEEEATLTLEESVNDELTPSSRVTRISWSPSGSRYAVASEDASVRVFTARS